MFEGQFHHCRPETSFDTGKGCAEGLPTLTDKHQGLSVFAMVDRKHWPMFKTIWGIALTQSAHLWLFKKISSFAYATLL